MAHHTITLNYGRYGFKPSQDLLVRQGDTISFTFAPTAPPNRSAPGGGYYVLLESNENAQGGNTGGGIQPED